MQSMICPSHQSAQFNANGLQPPVISSREHSWKNVVVEEFHQPPGEEIYQSATEHTLCLSLNPRPFRLYQKIGDRRHIGLATKGDLAFTPAETRLVSQWSQNDKYLRIRIAAEFMNHVAQSELENSSSSVELLPNFRAKNLQIEQIGMMLLSELYSNATAGKLYVESLANILAVHLLRNFSVVQPRIADCDGGLTSRQLLHITDYIHSHLANDIQLADLANLLELSHFHFSRLFKQSMGISPYQYLIQQRVERAKQLLKTTNLPVMEIALQCGFSSHSHLGKLLRQQTGLTPKEFRN